MPLGSEASNQNRYLSNNGDYRGRYGYGRPAHGADPSAHYTFADQRLLPSGSKQHDMAGK